MPNRVRILGVNGSMREGSHSALALGIAMQAAAENGGETRLLDLRSLDLPMLRPDQKSEAACVKEATAAVLWADAYIVSTPDYHGGMSGAMKNFLDHFWHEFEGKLFSYVCSSHEKGLTVMDQMRTTVRQCYAWSLPYGVTVNGSQDFDKQGVLLNESAGRRLRMLGRDTAVYGALLIARYRADIDAAISDTFARHN